MKAVAIHELGGPEVLKPGDLPEPTPAPGEALVRVRAVALNHLDVWTRKGQAGVKTVFPHVLGDDIAGEIATLTSPIDGLAVGQRVMLNPGTSCGRCAMCLSGEDNQCRAYRILGHARWGGYAQLVAVPYANVIPIPDHVAFEQAAAFPLVFLTAWRMLVTRARVKVGEDVLVWAAGSGVGMAAIQIAKLHGARVIATAGDDKKLARAKEIGADETIHHHQQDVVVEVRKLTGKKGADVVVEHVGEKTWDRSILAVATGGRIVTCGATTGTSGTTNLAHLFARQLALLGSYMGSKAELLAASRFFFAGPLRPVVHTVLPLEDAARAHELLERSEHFGKIVLSVA